jgi:hypothetical protein
VVDVRVRQQHGVDLPRWHREVAVEPSGLDSAPLGEAAVEKDPPTGVLQQV